MIALNDYVIGLALFLIFTLALGRALYMRNRRPKFLYGKRQSVALVQRARRARFETREELLEIRPFSQSA